MSLRRQSYYLQRGSQYESSPCNESSSPPPPKTSLGWSFTEAEKLAKGETLESHRSFGESSNSLGFCFMPNEVSYIIYPENVWDTDCIFSGYVPDKDIEKIRSGYSVQVTNSGRSMVYDLFGDGVSNDDHHIMVEFDVPEGRLNKSFGIYKPGGLAIKVQEYCTEKYSLRDIHPVRYQIIGRDLNTWHSFESIYSESFMNHCVPLPVAVR